MAIALDGHTLDRAPGISGSVRLALSRCDFVAG
jgi:hypothetical protein